MIWQELQIVLKRAKNVDDDSENNFTLIDYSGCPTCNCSIHLGEGPEVIWMDRPEDLEVPLSDHAMTFPLDHFSILQKCIKPNPVCGDCAQAFIDHSNKRSVYHESIVGYVPTNYKDNKKIFRNQLCKILCSSKLLSHVDLLFLAVLDDINYTWFNESVKSHIMAQMIDNVITTDNFQEDGKKVTLKEAISNLDTNKILRHPIIAAVRLLSFVIRYTQIKDDNKYNILFLLKEVFAYKLVEMMLNIFLRESPDVMIDKINDMIYETICGVPIADIYEPKMVKLTEVVSKLNNGHVLLRLLTEIAAAFQMNVDDLVKSHQLSQIICSLKSIETHERPLNFYTKLVNTKIYKTVDTNNEEQSKETIKNKLIGQYKETDHKFVPPYSFYFGKNSGPSKLFFNDEQVITTNTLNLKNFNTAQEISDLFQKNLNNKIANKFGNNYPNQYSGHCPLHRIVATVLEENFPDTDVVCDEMYLNCFAEIKNTKGLRGNIYNFDTIQGLIFAVNDFCRIRGDARAMNKNIIAEYRLTDDNNKTFSAKLTEEFNHYSITDTVDYTKITIPVSMTVTYKDIDMKSLINRLNNKYRGLDHKNIDTNNIIELKMNEVINIDIPLEQQDEEAWKREQCELVKQLNLTDKIDINKINHIGGMDISFDKDEPTRAVASLVIFDKDLKVLCRASIKCSTNIKYKVGLLAFREVPILFKLLSLVKEYNIVPDVILMDGNGVWHPRGLGIASHFSLLSGIPCVGVAKKVLMVEDVTEESVLNIMKNVPDFETVKIQTQSGKVLGAGFNVTGGYKNSTYISTGNGLSLDSAIELVKRVTIHRVTEPIRHADLLSRELLERFD